METFIIIVIVLWLVWLSLKQKALTNIIAGNHKDLKINNSDNEEITDEIVAQNEKAFEEEIFGDNYSILPDSISSQEIYIYRHLMLPWFRELSAKSRYKEEEIKKIRKDWVDYLEALKDRSLYAFLASEEENEEAKKEKDSKHIIASKKVWTIEDAFASAISKEAVKELDRIREITRFGAFNNRGELAPDGFRFEDGELIPDKDTSMKNSKKKGIFF